MYSKLSFFGGKIVGLAFILSLLLVPFHTALAQDAEGITIQKDVYLSSPILGVEDLPAELTVSLYDAAGATVPIATQTFARGQYNLDFELSKSNGLELGPIARLKVDFTNKLNIGDDPDNPTRVKEIWSEVAVNGQPVGVRTQVSDETLVKLLLASDASIATYITLAYEGDTNPITTIYKGLPLSSASGLSPKEYITSLFSAVSTEDRSFGSTTPPYWELNGTNIYYNGSVGIWKSDPGDALDVNGNITVFDSIRNPTETGKVTIYGSKTFNNGAKLEFWGGQAPLYPGHIYLDYGNYTTAIDPGAKFNVRAMSNGTVINAIVANASGNVGIRTVPNDTYTLAVNGKIGCQELTVTNTGWSDFVFEDNYKLPSLSEVEAYISTNKHLPGIPTEAEVKEKGVSVGDISSKLLQKIEELTLYMIDLKKENEDLKGQLAAIHEQIGNGTK